MSNHKRVLNVLFIILISIVLLSLSTTQLLARKHTKSVLAGGGINSSNVEIFEDIVAKAGGAEGKICVVPASSYPWNWDLEYCTDVLGLTGEEAFQCADDYGWDYGNSKINIEWYGQILESFGIGQYTGIYIDPTLKDQNTNPELIEAAEGCTGFFFTGGDQSRAVFSLKNEGKPSPLLKAIIKRVKKGALMSGTSAGTAIQTKRFMIANGRNPLALVNGASSAVWDATERDLVYSDGVCGGSCDDLLFNEDGGIGTFRYGITDTHFSDSERALRLLRLLADTRHRFGFGIDTDTSLSVENDLMQVIGQDGVTVLDLSRARVKRRADNFEISGVRISYIRPGDTYNAKKKRFTLAGSEIEEVDTQPIVNNDIMDELDAGGFQMVGLLSDLAKSKEKAAIGYSLSDNPRFQVTLEKDRKTRTAIRGDNVSVVNMQLSVKEY
ncbi:MAG: cyanophycinase [Proteobacteria bacterium]|nr:cyanophycinase [Pseudomonadota bacterium]